MRGSPPADVPAAHAILLEAVSREIRTTLALANGYCQTLLQMDVSDAERARGLERIAAANRHIAELSNEMLELTTGGNDGYPACQPVSVSALIAKLSRQLDDAESEPRFLARLPVDLPLVSADPLWIVNVLKVIVAMLGGDPDDQRVVHVSARALQDRVVIGLRVGDGAEPIAGRYVPTSSTRALALRLAGGDAIARHGLEFCRQLVEAHGGVIWVDERPNEARVSFTLPRFCQEEATVTGSRAAEVPCLEHA